MPAGQRERSLRSSPAHRSVWTLVAAAMLSSEIPRFTRSRLRFGPNASRSLMDVLPDRKNASTADQEPIGQKRPETANGRVFLCEACVFLSSELRFRQIRAFRAENH